MKTKSLLLSTLFATAMASQGAVIAWGDATTVSTVSDIVTTGTKELVEAVNLTGTDFTPGTETANGVTFTNVDSLLNSNNNTVLFFDGSDTGDAGYNAILNRLDFGNGDGFPDPPVELTLGGGNLVIGQEYLIQVWYSDTRASGRNMQFGDGAGNYVSLTSSTSGAEFAIGTFTADGVNQTLALRSSNLTNVHFNAYQIRMLPEPSSSALLGLGGLAFALRRRRADS